MMTRPLLFREEPKYVRDTLWSVIDLADEINSKEAILVEQLKEVDRKRLYLRFGFQSFLGFCTNGLHFTKTQAARIVKQVRKEPK